MIKNLGRNSFALGLVFLATFLALGIGSAHADQAAQYAAIALFAKLHSGNQDLTVSKILALNIGQDDLNSVLKLRGFNAEAYPQRPVFSRVYVETVWRETNHDLNALFKVGLDTTLPILVRLSASQRLLEQLRKSRDFIDPFFSQADPKKRLELAMHMLMAAPEGETKRTAATVLRLGPLSGLERLEYYLDHASWPLGFRAIAMYIALVTERKTGLRSLVGFLDPEPKKKGIDLKYAAISVFRDRIAETSNWDTRLFSHFTAQEKLAVSQALLSNANRGESHKIAALVMKIGSPNQLLSFLETWISEPLLYRYDKETYADALAIIEVESRFKLSGRLALVDLALNGRTTWVQNYASQKITEDLSRKGTKAARFYSRLSQDQRNKIFFQMASAADPDNSIESERVSIAIAKMGPNSEVSNHIISCRKPH